MGPEGYVILWFLSGKDGSILRVRPGRKNSANYHYAGAVGAGDSNRDGFGDYAVNVREPCCPGPDLSSVEVCSGRDDTVFWRVSHGFSASWFGYAVAADLDLDGDGWGDLVVTDPYHTEEKIYAYAHGGRPLYTLQGIPGVCCPGRSVAVVGDVDRDGGDDFVIGAFGQADTLGRAVLLSGRTGKVLQIGMGELPGDEIGTSVTGCGDLDLDGVPDFAAGGGGLGTRRGVVRAFSGRTGQPLFTLTGPPRNSGFGVEIGGGVDIDQDGIPDLAAIAPLDLSFYVFSGRDGTSISRHADPAAISLPTMVDPQPGSPFGVFLATSVAGDGGPGLPYLGRIDCYRGSPAGVEVFGAACRGTLATYPKIGIRDLGSKGVRIHLSGAEPNQPAALLLGLSRTKYGQTALPLPLYPYGFPSCLLFVSIDAVFGTTTDVTGYGSIDIPLPIKNPGTVTLYGQWIAFGAGSTAPGGVSAGMRWSH